MSRLPLSLSALSVLVAVVLWYLATVLEGNGVAEPRAGGANGVPEFGRQREESPVMGGAAALRCRQAESRMQALVDASQYCRRDEDCTIFDYGYPIECLTSVAKTEITALRLEYRQYERNCEFRVYYDCPSEPLERQPVCREGRCAVELRPLDDYLRDETLRHLGIDEQR